MNDQPEAEAEAPETLPARRKRSAALRRPPVYREVRNVPAEAPPAGAPSVAPVDDRPVYGPSPVVREGPLDAANLAGLKWFFPDDAAKFDEAARRVRAREPVVDPDPRVQYFARLLHTNPPKYHVVEFGTGEDWDCLVEALRQPEADRMEIWADDRGEGAIAVRLFPPIDLETAVLFDKLLAVKTGRPERVVVEEHGDEIRMILDVGGDELGAYVADLAAEFADEIRRRGAEGDPDQPALFPDPPTPASPVAEPEGPVIGVRAADLHQFRDVT